MAVSMEHDSMDRMITIKIEKAFDPNLMGSILHEALAKTAKEEAEKWIEANRDKILERLNIDAIANMIMLEVATQTKNNILEKQNARS